MKIGEKSRSYDWHHSAEIQTLNIAKMTKKKEQNKKYYWITVKTRQSSGQKKKILYWSKQIHTQKNNNKNEVYNNVMKVKKIEN